MKYGEVKKDLFTVEEDYYLAHCVSADFALGKGIAALFNKKFNMKNILKKNHLNYEREWSLTYGDCIKEGRVFNLVTKERYFHKPTLETMETAIKEMKKICLEQDIKKIAMPRIGCGLDRLSWDDVQRILFQEFASTNIEILVCYM